MKAARAPGWLAAFQERFGAALRAPLDSQSGAFRADPAAFAPELCAEIVAPAAAERLAIYNRQYWIRLFSALQTEFPLCAALLGAWRFNHAAAAFLEAHPPAHFDLARAADGFDAFLRGRRLPAPLRRAPDQIRAAPRSMIAQAATIDESWREALRAPEREAGNLAGLTLSELQDLRLTLAAGVRIVEERWPLCELRRDLREPAGARRLALPRALPRARRWIVFPAPGGVGLLRLSPERARLMDWLARETVADAIRRLDRACPAARRQHVEAEIGGWFAEGGRLGLWRPEAPRPSDRRRQKS